MIDNFDVERRCVCVCVSVRNYLQNRNRPKQRFTASIHQCRRRQALRGSNVLFALRLDAPQVERSPSDLLQHQIHDAHLVLFGSRRPRMSPLAAPQHVHVLFQLGRQQPVLLLLSPAVRVLLRDNTQTELSNGADSFGPAHDT